MTTETKPPVTTKKEKLLLVAKKQRARNLYGCPVLTKELVLWTKSLGYKLLIGVHSLDKATRKDSRMKIVVANIPLLNSFGIPVIGYSHTKAGSWTRTTLPHHCLPNELVLTVHELGRGFPSSRAYYEFLTRGKTEEKLSQSFTAAHETKNLTERLLGEGLR